MRTAIVDAPEMAGVIARSLAGTSPDIDCDTCSAEPGIPRPRHLRIGILDCRHHAMDATGDHRLDAGRRLADVRTGFQGYIERGTAGSLARVRQRHGLGVRPSACLRPAAS